MSYNKKLSAAVVAAGLVLGSNAIAADWQTTNIQLLKGFEYEPNNKERTLITVEHANGWKYGDNYLFFDITDADTDGTDIYGEISPRLSFSKMTGKKIGYGLVKDVLLAGSVEVGKNIRRYLYGVGFDLDIPKFKFFKVNTYVRDDPNKEGQTYQVTLAWNMPLEYRNHKFLLEGFADFFGREGDSFDDSQLIVPRFLLDVGNYWGQEKKVYAGVEWQYWHHKFGGATTESVPQLQLKWVF